jgi:predicted dehydrogenase
MAVRRIGVGIAGYGLAGRVFHATLVGHTPGLALRAVFSRTAERRAQAQHDHPGIAVHASYEALLADPSVEMVVVATPHDTHAAMVVAAAGAGKHVVVDKIMCLTVDEGEQMIGAARRAGVLFSVFQNRRWDSDYLTVKRVLASGLVGEPYVIESAVTSFGPSPGYRAPTSDRPRGWRSYAEFGGGPMRDWGAHLFDQAVQLVGPRPEWLFADFQYRRDWDVETAGTAWLRYSASEPPSGQVLPYGGAGTPVRGGRYSRTGGQGEPGADHRPPARPTPGPDRSSGGGGGTEAREGVRFTIEVGSISAIAKPRWFIRGSEGAYLQYGRDAQEAALHRGEVGPRVMEEANAPRVVRYDGGQLRDVPVEQVPGNYLAYYENVAAALRGEAPLAVLPENVLESIRLIVAAARSAETRQAVAHQ